jgi:hypothetical protein
MSILTLETRIEVVDGRSVFMASHSGSRRNTNSC